MSNLRLAKSLLGLSAISLAIVLMAVTSANATLIWDTVSGDGGAITEGAGTWQDGGGNWNTGSGDTTWSNAIPDVAQFGSAVGTTVYNVTVDSGGVTATGLTFNYPYALSGGTITLSGTPTISSATGDSNHLDTNPSPFINSVLAGSCDVTKSGAGMVTLTNQNTFSGAFSISQGLVSLNSSSGPALPGDVKFIPGSGSMYIQLWQSDQLSSSAVLHWTNTGNTNRGYLELHNASQTVAGLDSSTDVVTHRPAFIDSIEGTGNTLTINTASGANYSYIGALRDNGAPLAIVKKGTGTQTLLGEYTGSTGAGYMNFSGGLTVEEGTLHANISTRANSGFDSSIVVKKDGTLDVHDWTGFKILTGKSLSGNGSVVGDVVVAAGGSIEPGESIGTLTVTGNLTVAGGFEVEYDSDTDAIDMLAVSGDLNLADATITFTDLGAGSLAPGTYVFATYGGTLTEPTSPPTPPEGATINWALNGNSAALVVIPEPSTLILLALAGLALAAYRRKR